MLILDRLFGDAKNNKNKLAKILGTNENNILVLEQVHGDKIFYAHHPIEEEIPECDAIITDQPGLFLLIQIADCQAVYIKDPVKHVIANIHNGWRGSTKNIVGKVIDMLVEIFKSNPQDLEIYVSPSLGPCCAEFSDPYNELPKKLHEFILPNNHVNFWEITKMQCMEKGIPESNIEINGTCTVCNHDKFFSYRADKGDTGRNALITWI